MRRVLAFVALAVLVGVVLGASAFRNDLAQATGLAQAVTVANTPADPVPVQQQGSISAVPQRPASPWRAPYTGLTIGSNDELVVAGPTTASIDITSMSASVDLNKQAVINLVGFYVPDTDTTCNEDINSTGGKIMLVLTNVTTPVAVPFPTPLEWPAPAPGLKGCVVGTVGGVLGGTTGGSAVINASGFYG